MMVGSSAMAIVMVIVTVMVVPHHLGQIVIVRLGSAAHPEPHPEGVVRRQTGREQPGPPRMGRPLAKPRPG